MDNSDLFARARRHIPGGVNSPVRAFGAVGGTPRFISHAEGPYLYDVEGRRYIDHVLSWGPMILGHNHSRVVDTIRRQAGRGLSFGASTELEVVMAETVSAAMPSMEKLRFVNSGTEATMSAIRLARGFTGRELVVKFDGCYHGHVDSLLTRAGSGALTFGVPATAGVPAAVAHATLVLPYNDVRAFRELIVRLGSEIAAVIVEPVAGNMNMVLPAPGFLETLRQETEKSGALLIFDEVITGFRFCYGGYQDLVGLKPDLTCLGKIIGGGLPVGAFGGRSEIMDLLAPEGPVYQAGTLAGNPLAMAAGLATLNVLKDEDPYGLLGKRLGWLASEVEAEGRRLGLPLTFRHLGSMGGLFFAEGPLDNLSQVRQADAARYAAFFHALLEQGVYLAPSAFEAFFIGTAHSDAVLEETLAAMHKALAAL